MQIRIPTPVTAHIDNCDQCREDSKKLQNLGLSSKHLVTISRLFADELNADEMDCDAARRAIPAMVLMAYDQADAKTLRHLSLCIKCRQELYCYRETIINRIISSNGDPQNQHKQFACASVGADDIFDYAITYGIDPSDEHTKSCKSLTEHVVCCADCLDKIQRLHKTVYGIAERPESGVVTVFKINRAAEVKQQIEVESPYAGFPVNVERVDSGGTEQTHNEEYEKVVKLRPASKGLRPFLKIALPAAAMIMVAAGLFYHVSAAKGLGIERIYRAVDVVKNIHVSSIDPDSQKTVQDIWISRNSGLYVIKTKNQCVLRDINNRIRKDRLDTGTIEQTSLNGETLTSISTKIHSALDIMPFPTPTDIPAGSKWSEMTDSGLAAANGNTEVYELSWSETTSIGSTIQRSRRIIADALTNLPQKIQYFKQEASDPEPVLESIVIIEYPAEEEILAMTEAMSF
jgi:hypothetical protein